MHLTPKQAMQLAIEEGKKGAGFVSPNPLVGCVILDRDFNLIGQGYHQRIGEAHAEVQALNSVQDQSALKGAHVFVTLEPCAHDGRTPSCAKVLAKLPIDSVTYGLRDPNPLVSGQGAEIIRQGGKAANLFAELQAELTDLCEIFLTNMNKNRPFIALKVAATLDGKIARPDGTSQWISNEKSREHVQYIRGCYDSILVGTGTFLKDDPRLNSRDPRFAERRNRVVLLDPQGVSFSKLENSALLKVRAPEDVIVVSCKKHETKIPVVQIQLPMEKEEFPLKALLAALRAENIHSVLVEGGAHTYAGFIRQKLADRLYFFLAPKVMGEGLDWAAGVEAQTLRQISLKNFSGDLLISGLLGPADEQSR